MSGGEIYTQIDWVAMGSSWGLALAGIFTVELGSNLIPVLKDQY